MKKIFLSSALLLLVGCAHPSCPLQSQLDSLTQQNEKLKQDLKESEQDLKDALDFVKQCIPKVSQ